MKQITLFLLLSIISCSSKSDDLYVGTNAEFAPFEYLDGDMVTGFDIDLINAIAKEMKREIKIQNLTWEGLLPALQGKKIDLIISGMTKTSDREKIVNFSDTYFVSPEQMIIVHQTNMDIQGMDDLKNKKIGVVLGFTGDTVAHGLTDVIVERFNSAFATISALQTEKIDAILLDYATAQNFIKTTSGLKSISGNNSSEEYAIAIRKEDVDLLENINTALAAVRKSGQYDVIYQKYFPSN